MAPEYKEEYERDLLKTPTWAVAVVCFVLVIVSLFIEHIIHIIGKWLKNKHKKALYEALEKIKGELMILGFISLLLIVLQAPISDICIPKSIGATWHPCKKGDQKSSEKDSEKDGRKLLQFLDSGFSERRILAAKEIDKCTKNGQVAFVSKYGIHQLHIFIFVLAVFHVLYCITTLALGRTKMSKWRAWEDETRTIEYQYYNVGRIKTMSEQIERERSSEEEDTLARSTKKYKDHHPSPSCGAHSKGETLGSGFSSYRDRLVGAIPGAYEQAFGFASSVHGDGEMDEDAADLREGCVAIGLSREEKQRIRAPWALSIIVKTFGRKGDLGLLASTS